MMKHSAFDYVASALDWSCHVQQSIRLEGEDGGTATSPPPPPPPPATTSQPDPAAPAEPQDGGGEPKPDDSTATSSASAPAEPVSPKVPDWKERQLKKKNEKIGELQSEIERLKAGGVASASINPNSPEFRAAVTAEATRVAALQAEAARHKAVVEAGQKQFSDFNEKVGTFMQFFDPKDQKSVDKYNQIVEAVLDMPDSAAVLHALGSNPEEVERLADLSPVKMGLALSKIAAKAAPEPVVPPAAPLVDALDNALALKNNLGTSPKPISPVGSRGLSHEEISPSDPSRSGKLSTETWMARRNEEVAALRESRRNASRTRH